MHYSIHRWNQRGVGSVKRADHGDWGSEETDGLSLLRPLAE
uniref:Uncharacterized protein n=1 Tax=Anguilla anguilla TaxID=7936 RepID=A0A0E9U4D3_ANGAN